MTGETVTVTAEHAEQLLTLCEVVEDRSDEEVAAVDSLQAAFDATDFGRRSNEALAAAFEDAMAHASIRP